LDKVPPRLTKGQKERIRKKLMEHRLWFEGDPWMGRLLAYLLIEYFERSKVHGRRYFREYPETES
jgi:hypothetical protein